MDDRDLEKLRGGPNKPSQFRMRVSLSKTNVLSFNRNTYEQLGKPPAVYLYFSRTRDVIAIEPVRSLNMPLAFPVLEKNISGYRVNAAPFCRHFGITIDDSVRFIDPEMRSGKLELRLADIVSVAQVRRRKPRS